MSIIINVPFVMPSLLSSSMKWPSAMTVFQEPSVSVVTKHGMELKNCIQEIEFPPTSTPFDAGSGETIHKTWQTEFLSFNDIEGGGQFDDNWLHYSKNWIKTDLNIFLTSESNTRTYLQREGLENLFDCLNKCKNQYR